MWAAICNLCTRIAAPAATPECHQRRAHIICDGSPSRHSSPEHKGRCHVQQVGHDVANYQGCSATAPGAPEPALGGSHANQAARGARRRTLPAAGAASLAGGRGAARRGVHDGDVDLASMRSPSTLTACGPAASARDVLRLGRSETASPNATFASRLPKQPP